MRQRAAAAAAADAHERDADPVEHARHRGVDDRARARLARSPRARASGADAAAPASAPARRRSGIAGAQILAAATASAARPAISARAEQRPDSKPRDERVAAGARAAAMRPTRSSTTCRPMSSSRPYWTPDGHVVSQTAAREAAIEMQLRLRRDLAAFEHLLDEVDASARAVELVAQQLVRRDRSRCRSRNARTSAGSRRLRGRRACRG